MMIQHVELRGNQDLLTARLSAREMAKTAGLGIMDQTRFATGVSELVRNALIYATGGVCELRDLSDAGHIRLQAKVHDQGPGIADLKLALTDGYSSHGNLGMGLSGTKRLVDDFHIESSAQGTLVRIQILRRHRMV
jgi:serine/threonine-protein kinase RsbT